MPEGERTAANQTPKQDNMRVTICQEKRRYQAGSFQNGTNEEKWGVKGSELAYSIENRCTK